MTHTQTNFGIVTERNFGRFTIFDTDNLTVLHQINTPFYDYIDVAITSDCSRALITAFDDNRVVQLDLIQEPPQVIDDEFVPVFAEDVALTPDNNFGVIVDGEGAQPIISYSLLSETIVDTIPNMNLQGVAVSPNGNGLVLGVEFSNNNIRILTIDNTGNLTDTGTTVGTGGDGPNNITFHSTGNFAFVPNVNSGNISVFNISGLIPVLLTTIPTNSDPQTVIVSGDGNNVFVLTGSTVDVFTFTPSSPFLTLVNSFPHGLSIVLYFGVDQMALDSTQSRLFISASDSQVLAAFTIGGAPLGTVPGVLANGGVVTCLLQLKPFIITCSNNITVRSDPRSNGAIVNYPDPMVTDNCPGVTFSCIPVSGSFFPMGETPVTCTAIDTVGNAAQCSFVVNVIADPCSLLS